MIPSCRSALLVGLITLAPFAHAASVSDDFSPTSNPSGDWSYGTSATLGGTFAFDTNHTSSNGLDYWYGSSPGFASYPGYPFIAHNAGAADVILPGGIGHAAGQVAVGPGPGGEYAVVRWTAPATGAFSLAAAFNQLAISTTTDVHVLLNGAALFNGVIETGASIAAFASGVLLTQGDIISFAVGYGANRDHFADTTGLIATVTPVPELSTFVLLAAGMFAVLGASRRNRVSHRN
jgi:hypothetical protein